jgi:hypothetical protein
MVLSIFLIVITSIYVLPVKELLCEKQHICMADMDETKDDVCKKEKVKDLFAFTPMVFFIEANYHVRHLHPAPGINTVLHTVETPPPDLV